MDKLIIKRKEYFIDKVVKISDYHTSYICIFKNKKFFIRKFKDSVVFNRCIDDYKKIKKIGICIPKMLKIDKKEMSIIYEFIDAEDCARILTNIDIDDAIFEKLFLLRRFARFSKVDLNYLPENFKYYNGELYYMSYEFFKESQEKSLEDYGMYYWIYGTVAMNHLAELGLPIDKSRVLTTPEVKKKIVLLSIMKW
ncbi:MAG: hypothetical protein HUJ61_04455 [Bacilli bacterium]|nr:hypothetical protein [Bacilli bacterium]